MMVKRVSYETGSDDVEAYIAKCPRNVQGKLKEIRGAILVAAPGAAETMSYFQIPGYSYPGYDYNGMFAWFGLQGSHVRLLLRPPTLRIHEKELSGYAKTKSALHLPLDKKVPVPLVKKLVKTSVRVMKDKPRKEAPAPRA